MLYVKVIDVLCNDPVQVTRSYPIGIREHDYKDNSGDLVLGQPVTYLGDGMDRGTDGRKYRLFEGGSTKPAFFPSEPVPSPLQRAEASTALAIGQASEKQTRAGWKTA